MVGGSTKHQPFLHEDRLYYTDDWPNVRIYREGVVYLDHFDGYVQVGNPHWGDGVMYFEARRDPDPRRPEGWEVWMRDMDGELRYLCKGANPAYHNGWLYWGEWNGQGFTYRRSKVT